MRILWAWVRRAVMATAAVGCALSAQAGVVTRDELKARFPPPLMIGEKETQLPIWPVFKQDATATVLVGYAFESTDLAPIPGFSGTPPNLLVLLDAKGSLADQGDFRLRPASCDRAGAALGVDALWVDKSGRWQATPGMAVISRTQSRIQPS